MIPFLHPPPKGNRINTAQIFKRVNVNNDLIPIILNRKDCHIKHIKKIQTKRIRDLFNKKR